MAKCSACPSAETKVSLFGVMVVAERKVLGAVLDLYFTTAFGLDKRYYHNRPEYWCIHWLSETERGVHAASA